MLVALSKCTCACLPLRNFFWDLAGRDEDRSDNVISGHPLPGLAACAGALVPSSTPTQPCPSAYFPSQLQVISGTAFYHWKVNFSEYLPLLWKQEICKNFEPETLPSSAAQRTFPLCLEEYPGQKAAEHGACHSFWPWDLGETKPFSQR